MNGPSEPGPEPPPGWWSEDFRESSAASAPLMGRGMIGHVPLVATLLIVQGSLEILLGALFVVTAALILLAPEPELEGLHVVSIALVVLGAVGALGGLVRIVAGCFNLRYRHRTLGMVALAAGLITMVTGYCAPTSIALAVYGLIVYVNESVVVAFHLGDKGRSLSEILAAFPPPR